MGTVPSTWLDTGNYWPLDLKQQRLSPENLDSRVAAKNDTGSSVYRSPGTSSLADSLPAGGRSRTPPLPLIQGLSGLLMAGNEQIHPHLRVSASEHADISGNSKKPADAKATWGMAGGAVGVWAGDHLSALFRINPVFARQLGLALGTLAGRELGREVYDPDTLDNLQLPFGGMYPTYPSPYPPLAPRRIPRP